MLGGALGWTSACLYVRFRGVGGPVAERPDVSVIQPEDLSSTSRFRDSWEREAAATGTGPTARGVAAMASWRHCGGEKAPSSTGTGGKLGHSDRMVEPYEFKFSFRSIDSI